MAGGKYLGADDKTVLQEVAKHNYVLVSYDLRTMQPVLKEFAEQEVSHAGVVLVDEKTTPPNNFGALARVLSSLAVANKTRNWENRVVFLRR